MTRLARALAAAALSIASAAQGEPTWRELLTGIRETFPGVPQIGARELRASVGPRTLIVDVREREEYDVSRLPGARWTQRVSDVRAWFSSGDYERVVVYCSVGYRSSKFVQELQRAGFAHAANLEGSIFAWANAGYPLENEDGPTSLVHPFDPRWGRLLDRKFHPAAP
ncbi:MAG: rhodanese-like domain-containing protein [Deltaproteobacteria bacterium]|nr:rhodanese-like domain-containing protein [Deltaproteobacteria bacterium]